MHEKKIFQLFVASRTSESYLLSRMTEKPPGKRRLLRWSEETDAKAVKLAQLFEVPVNRAISIVVEDAYDEHFPGEDTRSDKA